MLYCAHYLAAKIDGDLSWYSTERKLLSQIEKFFSQLKELFLSKLGKPCLESIRAVGLSKFFNAASQDMAVSEVSQGLQVSRLGVVLRLVNCSTG